MWAETPPGPSTLRGEGGGRHRQVSWQLCHARTRTHTPSLPLHSAIHATAVGKPQSFTARSPSISAQAVTEPIDRFKGKVDPTVNDPGGLGLAVTRRCRGESLVHHVVQKLLRFKIPSCGKKKKIFSASSVSQLGKAKAF